MINSPQHIYDGQVLLPLAFVWKFYSINVFLTIADYFMNVSFFLKKNFLKIFDRVKEGIKMNIIDYNFMMFVFYSSIVLGIYLKMKVYGVKNNSVLLFSLMPFFLLYVTISVVKTVFEDAERGFWGKMAESLKMVSFCITVSPALVGIIALNLKNKEKEQRAEEINANVLKNDFSLADILSIKKKLISDVHIARGSA